MGWKTFFFFFPPEHILATSMNRSKSVTEQLPFSRPAFSRNVLHGRVTPCCPLILLRGSRASGRLSQTPNTFILQSKDQRRISRLPLWQECFEDKLCITGNVKVSPGEAVLQGATLTGTHTSCVQVGVQKEMASKKRRWERYTQHFHWHLVFCLWHCYCCCYLCATKKCLECYWIVAANRFFSPPSVLSSSHQAQTVNIQEHKHISWYELSFYFAWVRHCQVIFSHKSSTALRDGLSAVHYFDSNWNVFKWLNCH